MQLDPHLRPTHTVFWVLLPIPVFLVALTSFAFGAVTSSVFAIGFFLCVGVAEYRNLQHQVQYDDHLSDEAIEAAKEWVIRDFGGGDSRD